MAAQKAFIDRNLQFVQVNEYLNRELKLAGQGKIEIHKTPMGHRVVIHAVRLGMVIGRRGRNIRKITDDLESIYRLETPQVEVKDLDDPRLNARVMAGRLISQIQKGFHFRRAGYALVRRIMSANARGCEITIKGKLTSQRARTETFREGFVAKCGEPADKFVDEAVMEVTMKQGVIGVHVKIMQADAILPDDARLILNVFPPEEETEVVEEAALTDDIEPEEITIEEEPLPEETTEIEEIIPEKTVEIPEVEEIVPEETKETKKAAKAKAAKEAKEAAKAEKAAKAKAAKEAKEAAKAEKAAKAKAAKEAKKAKKGKKAEKEEELLKKEDFNEEE
ncbi:MAG: 30S ribosomal protein S3 [Candidatus Hodarchaeales archaeon]|jgi:small subunit ribosomal protein S3